MFLNMLTVFKILIRAGQASVLALTLGCSANNLEGISDTTTKKATLYAVKEAIRKGQYTTAIDLCEAMPASYFADVEVAENCASAFAGRCGYALLSDLAAIQDYITTAPPEMLFEHFMIQLTSTSATQMDDCHAAEEILRSIGDASTRTGNQNVFMLFLAIKKISVIVNETADATDDGIVDGGFDACNAGSLSDALAGQIGSAFWELNASATALAANPFYTPIETAVSAMCTALNGLGQDLCAAADPTTLTANELKGARSLIREGAALGLDLCTGDESVVTCNCP